MISEFAIGLHATQSWELIFRYPHKTFETVKAAP
jgi:hypothetical protein